MSRVSLGRGYLDALGKWPSTRLGGELFSKNFGFGSVGAGDECNAERSPCGERLVEPSRQPLVRSQVQSQESEPSPAEDLREQLGGGRGRGAAPKKK